MLLIGATLAATAARADNTAWMLHSDSDPMTDAPEALAMTEGDAGVSAIFGCPAPHKAAWLLTSSKFDLQFEPARSVRLRVDSSPPEAMTWQNLKSGGVGLKGDEATKLAKRVEAARTRLVFDDGSGPIVLSLEGASGAIAKALSICQLK
ncbi:hypothetical protein [Methylovirgula ligni]|nr:hypothetical protein [Methylovirgula ligni]